MKGGKSMEDFQKANLEDVCRRLEWISAHLEKITEILERIANLQEKKPQNKL